MTNWNGTARWQGLPACGATNGAAVCDLPAGHEEHGVERHAAPDPIRPGEVSWPTDTPGPESFS